MRRSFWVWLHRWAGLTMAGLLIVVGLTGSLLAFYPEIERAINPQFYPAQPCTAPLGPGELAARLETARPVLRVTAVTIEGNQGATLASVKAAPGAPALTYDNVFLSPCDGSVLFERRFGDLSQGLTNLMGFVYRLHYELALGKVGIWILGICALIWTLDCFVALYLTFPIRRRRPISNAADAAPGKSWLARWRPAWKVRWSAGPTKLNFDLHRAGGLWLWPALLVFAWSSVYMNLWDTVYTWTTRAVMEFHAPWTTFTPRAERLETPRLGWREAEQRGIALMSAAAQTEGFTIERPVALRLRPEWGTYEYRVRSSLDLQDKRGTTRVWFDADTGTQRLLLLPQGQYTGNTVTNWLYALHMASVFGLPYRIFVSALGLVITMLSVTGIIIWLKKRRASRLSRKRRRSNA
ncbi:MAG TPA: PepSY-associated TM helix domain-containing protein [Candidatus Macondimonas sp.]|nr:PepSY-associated TM helix domain-containing protein [Candidatus Macondimonas sp.]